MGDSSGGLGENTRMVKCISLVRDSVTFGAGWWQGCVGTKQSCWGHPAGAADPSLAASF